MDFVRDIFGGHPWSKQREILQACVDHPRVSVRSCHGVGKTWTAACVGLHHLFTRPNSILITTAPTWRQVRELLWREIRANFRKGLQRGVALSPSGELVDRSLFGRCNTTDIQIAEQWFALGLSTDDPDRFVGFHAEDIMLIGDEAAGIAEDIFNAAEGILTSAGARMLLIGNPTAISGTFFRSHHEQRDAWVPIPISAYDSPNFTDEWQELPRAARRKLISQEWVDGRKRDWGETSPIYRTRVLGQFPRQAVDSLFNLDWIEGAARREFPIDLTTNTELIEAGVDIARHGDCETAIYIRRGPRILYFEAWRDKDLDWTTKRLAALFTQHGIQVMRIDATGMGSGVYDALAALGYPVQAVFVGTRSSLPEQFPLLRDEIAVALADRFREGDVGPLYCPTPMDEPETQAATTMAQMAAIKISHDPRGRRKVETKDEMQKRGEKSPDRFDALCLAFMGGGAAVAAAGNIETDPLTAWNDAPMGDRDLSPWSQDLEDEW